MILRYVIKFRIQNLPVLAKNILKSVFFDRILKFENIPYKKKAHIYYRDFFTCAFQLSERYNENIDKRLMLSYK